MTRTVHLAISLPAPPARLYEMYLNPQWHAAFTGAPAKIGRKPGTPFSAFGGILTGRILQAVPKRLVVQSWRSRNWKPTELDSTLILTFLPEGGGGRIELVHVNVPESDFGGVSQGWMKFYAEPWRAWLERER
ncbi:MAG: SRPBCC domain-containing protein [Planctomycetota bacterium]|nr:SRPBCC domain-containing protein [Planctomycetota bacterium]